MINSSSSPLLSSRFHRSLPHPQNTIRVSSRNLLKNNGPFSAPYQFSKRLPSPSITAAASIPQNTNDENTAGGAGDNDNTNDFIARTQLPKLPRKQKNQSLPNKLKAASARFAVFLKLSADSQSFKIAWHSIQFTASILFVGLYVWGTYSQPTRGSVRYCIELGLCVIFALEYFHRFFFKHPDPGSKIRMVASPRNIVDLLSFAPPLVEAALQQFLPSFTFGRVDLRWFKLLRSIRVVRIGLLGTELRALNLSTKRGGWLSAGTNFRLVQLAMSVFMLLFVASSIIQIVEQIPFHKAIYFVATTLSTVGYGDVIVTSFLGRACVLAMIAVGIVLIPVQAAAFYSEVSARRVIRGSLPDWRGKPFVLLSTRLTEVRAFSDLFAEFQQALGSARFPVNTKIVALCNRPSFEFSAFQELHERAVTLVEGSAVSGQDLVTVQAEKARAILLLSDRFSTDPEAEDLGILFQVWAAKSYTKTVPLFVQTVRQSTVHQIAPFLDPGQDVIVSMEQTRFRLLALSAVCPGASTLVGNLLRSSSVRPEEARESTLAGRRWLRQYVNGCESILCKAPMQRHLSGRRFIDISEWLFRMHGYTAIGIIDSSRKIRLNPSTEIVSMGMTLLVMGPNKVDVRRALASSFVACAEDTMEWSRGVLSDTSSRRYAKRKGARTVSSRKNAGSGSRADVLGGSGAITDSYDNNDDIVDESQIDARDDDGSDGGSGSSSSSDDGYDGYLEECVPVLFGNPESDSIDADMLPCVPPHIASTLSTREDLEEYMIGNAVEMSGGNSKKTAAAAVNNNNIIPNDLGSNTARSDASTVTYSFDGTVVSSQNNNSAPTSARTMRNTRFENNGESVFSGHFIVCGHGDSIVPFMSYLRTAEPSNTNIPIVILAPSPPEDLENARQIHGPIEYVQGSSTEASALRAAGAATAKALVFLARGSRPVKSAQATGGTVEVVRSTREAVLADASALLACYGVGEESGAALTHAVVELLFTTSIEFLQPGLLLKGVNLIYDDASLPHGQPRKSWLMRAWQQREAVAEGLAEWQANPYYAAGRVTVPALMDTFATQCFFNKGLMSDVLAELAGDLDRSTGSDDGSGVDSHSNCIGALLQLIDLPPGLYGRTYGECFMAMSVNRKLVCLGLYRRKSENPGTRLSYVVANPSWSEYLEATDRVFVLQERPLGVM